jgi:poly(A) polymerase
VQQIILSPAWLRSEAVQALCRIAQTESLQVRFVGGCVRDTLMRRMVGDIDVATPHSPEHIMQACSRHDVHVIPTGIKHGTVTVRLHGISFEITTLRRDVACDGRHAEVAFVEEWEDDARRRDFTMNALYMDAEGMVYDYVGGIADAQKGLVRFIGDAEARIMEDYLRIVRFFRFYALYGKVPLLHHEVKACRVHRTGLKQLSVERIASEMQKLFVAPRPVAALLLMQEAGLWEVITQTGEVYITTLQHLIAREESIEYISESEYSDMPSLRDSSARLSKKELLFLQRIIAYAGVDGALALCTRWKLPKKMWRFVSQVTSLAVIEHVSAVRHAVEQCGGDKAPIYTAIMLYTPDEHWRLLWDYAHAYIPVPCPVTGDVLLQHGFTQGEALRHALQRVRRLWVESDGTADTEKLLEVAKNKANDLTYFA